MQVAGPRGRASEGVWRAERLCREVETHVGDCAAPTPYEPPADPLDQPVASKKMEKAEILMSREPLQILQILGEISY